MKSSSLKPTVTIPKSRLADSRSFVLCPGRQYDRSPCGTGTSAKLACLHADGRLAPGQVWRQESVIGSIFEGSFEVLQKPYLKEDILRRVRRLLDAAAGRSLPDVE